ncbi:MAG: CPBP family intramembrane metalloprotease [Methanobrevibacter sp.]|nr:CPBP family intramembrane metalloprotease [Methanobrevibacter sp.]MBR1611602.1 CPBP family intramembrane metalloprotease [Methanobrevibacter sp.]
MDRSVANFNTRLRTIRIRDLLVGLIVSFILLIVLMGIFPEIWESDDLFFIIYVGLILLFFAWALKGTRGLNSDFQDVLKKENFREIIYVFAINIIFACLFLYLISLLDMILGFGDPTWVSIWDIDSVSVDSSLLLFDAIASIIFAPVVEELIFRGILFNRLKIRIGIIPAMILSSFLFGIGHDFGGITSAFLFGMCMCILYLKTDNILIPISVHFINNVVATVMELTPFDAVTAQFPLIIPSLTITLIGTYYLIKYIVDKTTEIKKQYS